MNRHTTFRFRMNRSRRGFSLVEAAIAMLIVGTTLVAALGATTATRMSRSRMTDRALGVLLAQDLMTEILQLAYVEPVETAEMGRESSESGGDRADYDDVDDYNEWSSSPPEYKDGTEIPDLNGWTRTVAVEYLKSNDLTKTSTTDKGIKRITVTVEHNDATVAELVAIKTGASVGTSTPEFVLPTGI